MKYVTRKRILKFTSARSGRNWLKKIRFKRYDNLSLYSFLKIFAHNVDEDEILDRANSVSYNFILAIFPAVIFLFTLIPYISSYFPAINTDSIMVFLEGYLPPSMFEVISSTILDIVSKERGGLLTFGFLFSMFLATNGMMALMRAFNACYRTVEKRSVWRMRITALGLTLMLALALLTAVVLLIVGQVIIDYLIANAQRLNINLTDYTIYLIFILRFVIIFAVFFIAISCIYYFGPAVHYNWNFFSVGSRLATLAGLGVSYGFSYYVSHFGSYNKVYGSIGALIALMIWIQLLTTVLLFGYEINASLHYGRKMEVMNMNLKNKRLERAMR
ncbi:MAG: YihY/virulence factor BrkB family protein [Cyclobacteriaceae bacterium]|jgi:membrane protein|nr:YihY/virulence factor BrkB family protein [Cyclobacteriaceae bacterium]